MKTSSLMMCALVALTACGTGVKQSVRTPVEMGERIELKTPDQDGTDYQRSACGAQLVARLFSGDALSGGTFGCTVAAAGVNREDGHLTALRLWRSIPFGSMLSCLKVCIVTIRKRMY